MKLRGLLVVAMVCLLAVASLAAPALAVPPEQAGPPVDGDIFFVVPTWFGDPNTSEFTALGQLVDDGYMCPQGEVVDTWNVSSPWHDHGPILFTIVIDKTFTCYDGSGAFVIRLHVTVWSDTADTAFDWRVVGGTGDYAWMRGSGTGVGNYSDSPVGDIDDYYTGYLRFLKG